MTTSPEPAQPTWMAPLGDLWSLVPDDLQPSLAPLKEQAICWGLGAIPAWPPHAWLVEDRAQADLLNGLIRPGQSTVVVLHRQDCAATVGADALTFPLLALAGAQHGWIKGLLAGQQGAQAGAQQVQQATLGVQLGMLLTAMTVGLYRRLPQLCTEQELQAAYQEANRVSTGVFKALQRGQGGPTPEDFGMAPDKTLPAAPQAATAPLHLPADHVADSARPFGYLSNAMSTRAALQAQDERWYGHSGRYL